MRKFLYVTLIIGSVATLAYAATIRRETVRWDFVNGIRAASYSDLNGNAVLQAGTEGETIVNTVDGTFDLTRDEAGTVTVTASDDDATAALTILPGGAAALTLGGASTTAVTVTTDSTGNAEVVVPTGSIGATEISASVLRVAYCGQLAENGEIFLGAPALTAPEPALADTTCDALDNATEGTADVVLSAGLTLVPRYMRCTLNGTLGASETLTAQLRDDTADVTGVTCSMAEAQTECEVLVPTASAIAAGSATAVEANEASNNADDDLKCVVFYNIQ
jgi:hypothetical protein